MIRAAITVSDATRESGLRSLASAVQTIAGSSERPFGNQAVQDACTGVFPQVEQSPCLRHCDTEARLLAELSADSHEERDSRSDIAPVDLGNERDVLDCGSRTPEARRWLPEIHDELSSSGGRPDVGDTLFPVFSERWNADNRGRPQFPIGETRGERVSQDDR